MEKQAASKTARDTTPIPPGDDDLCRALWLSVIVQAVIDAKSQRSRNCFRIFQNQAQDWIKGSSKEEKEAFEQVCDLAGVDPVKMRQLIERALKDEFDNFNFRCLIKHAKILRRKRESSQHGDVPGIVKTAGGQLR